MKFFVTLFAIVTPFSIAAAMDGDLDDTFGTSGIAQTAQANAGGYTRGLAVQTDGEIITCDRVSPSGSGSDEQFLVARFTTAGQLDSTFGTGGKTQVAFSSGSAFCNAAAIQADGKFVLAGASNGFAIARLNADGSLDTTFGVLGYASVAFGNGTSSGGAYGIAVQSDKKIVVAGATVGPNGRLFAVARFDAAGVLDPTFNSTGFETLDFGIGSGNAYAMAIDSSDRIVLAGYWAPATGSIESEYALVRLLGDGSPDPSFGSGGKVAVSLNVGTANSDTANALALQPDGKILAAGASDTSMTSAQNDDFSIVRLLDNGQLDTTFGTNGVVTAGFDIIANGIDIARGVTVQTNDKIVLGGSAFNATGTTATALRLNADGSIDDDFGKREYTLGDSGGFYSMTIAGTQIYAAGFIRSNGVVDDALVRLTNDQVFSNGFE